MIVDCSDGRIVGVSSMSEEVDGTSIISPSTKSMVCGT